MNMKINMKVNVLGMTFRNPLVLASGVAAYGEEYDEQVGLEGVGAIITKTVTRHPRTGNPSPRVCEVTGGMMNSIGLANPGIDEFIERELVRLEDPCTNVIVSIAGDSEDELGYMAGKLDPLEHVHALEVNLSCPNVDSPLLYLDDPDRIVRAVAAVRGKTSKPVIAKLSPNVADICSVARAAVEGGADGLSLINTLRGVKVDPLNRRFALGNIVGGLSGPAIRPVGVGMVYRVKCEMDVPVIAHGGIADHLSAVEYLLVGADLLALGSALFKRPNLANEVLDGLTGYLDNRKLTLDGIRGELL